MSAPWAGDGHVHDIDIAGYVDGALEPAARARVETHLADCASCRADALAALRSVRQPRRALTVGAPVLVAAAALAIWVVGRDRSDVVRYGRDSLRTGSDVAALAVVGVDTTSAHRVRFVWRSAAADASYRLTVLTVAGDPVWSGATGDTVLALPPTVRLARATAYYWFVDALLRDGRTLTSGSQPLMLGP